MSYYKYDKKKLDEIKKIDEKISKKQQQIFDILLKVSQSFSDENFSKEKRNELFAKVDTLKNDIKEYNEQIKEIKQGKIEEIIETEVEDEKIKQVEESIEKTENKNEEFVKVAQKLEDTLKENEIKKEYDEKKINNSIKNEETFFSKRKKARTQLVVVEDDDSLSGKIKEFFNKLRTIIKK